MQLVAETPDGGARDVDVQIRTPDATVADLMEALGYRADSAARGMRVDSRFLHADLALGEAGLHDGAVVYPALGPGRDGPRRHDGPVLAVVGGLQAGRLIQLAAGTNVVGRDPSADVSLTSSTVSARHSALEVDGIGQVTVSDLGSRNGTWIGAEPVMTPRELSAGDILRVGAAQLTLIDQPPQDRPLGLDPLRHLGATGNIPFNRPPRPAFPPAFEPLALPSPPRGESQRQPFSWAALLTPLVFGAVMAFISPYFALFALLSPIMLLGNWWESRHRGAKISRSEAMRYEQELAMFRERVELMRQTRARQLRDELPDPAEVLRRASAPSVRLWERRAGHDDFLRLSAGLGDVPWQPPLAQGDRPLEVRKLLAEQGNLPRVPVAVELADGGVVGIVGDREGALALARSLVCQAAVHHGPADLAVAILADGDEAGEWDWAKWLPHTRDLGGGDGARLLAGRQVDGEALLRGLLEGQEGREGGPVLLTVVDAVGLTEGRNAPARAVLRGAAGAAAGIVIAPTADRLPAVTTTVVELRDGHGTADLRRPQRGEAVEGLLAAGMDAATARTCATALARFEDPEVDVPGGSLPGRVDLVTLMACNPFGPEEILARWRAGGGDHGVVAPIGVAEDGTFTIDLVRDGPHGLLGGTTGSGKSELLRTLVVALALIADPDHLTFVLIDYKGGSAFDECARLPHVVGMVTDLDEHLGARALRCLEAELRHRERVLREAGAPDLPSYLQLPVAHTAPLPRLMVVIDEFATLAGELPDFIDALVGIAQRGRSLGVHLLLATQRPSGAVNDNIRANTNLRIALRVQDSADSTDVIGVPNAAQISRSQPGRGYVRLGPGEVVPIQTALVTGVTREDANPIEVLPFRFGPRPPTAPQPAAEATDDAPSDLTRIVAAVRTAFEAAGMRPPRQPWPPPLPTDLPLSSLLETAALPSDTVPVALADNPDAQAQYPTGWRWEEGNLLLYGLGGSGTTTTLASLALSLAVHSSPDRLHLYVLDFGAGELQQLTNLPHTGAVVGATDRERQLRLIRFLREELGRRRQLGAARSDEPRIVLLLDGYSAFRADFDDPVTQSAVDDVTRIFAEGPELGISGVASADRVGAVPTALAATVAQKWLFRLADPYDYSAFGVRPGNVPPLPPGRAIAAASGRVIHVGRPTPSLTEAVASLAADLAPPVRPPAALGTLPQLVAPEPLAASARFDASPWLLPIGIAEYSLGPAALRLYEGEHALIAGPARSGRTGALCALARLVRTAGEGIRLTGVAPRPSQLRDSGDLDILVDDGDRISEVLQALGVNPRPQLVLVDDAEALDDPQGAFEQLLRRRRPDVHLIVAGRADVLRSLYGHWTQSVRRSKCGVLLRPDVDLDGDLLGVRLPRRAPVAMTVGRGWLVHNGEVEFVQLATLADDGHRPV
ncbi:MAG: FtsK/SpoIIIE domain-containing protein [Actinomycetota bacterium]|nr:FtsK/SpoIIIE domain-containing protein [Actinomycetota bacterium]